MTRAGGVRPSLRVERSLHREGYPLVVGMDEVGRGALAGPVSVGVVAVDATCRSAPTGVRDSKLLTPAARRALVPRILRWGCGHGVGHAWPEEIDTIGIMAALRLAGRRALEAAGVRPDLVLLDGNHDWLTDPAREGLLGLLVEDDPDDAGDPADGTRPGADADGHQPPVRTMIKADLRCSSVACASVLAKVERDDLMVRAAAREGYGPYGWERNKGYASADHLAALADRGPSDWHRRSWRLS